ncbi:hypothetical protein [Niveibacterium umoris]|uniref:Uncharacterized protein n=1 Tax=Niveibacterium umoris TaxID=1193620 RepID=A0A840BK40_9RHOO|nr:hypothetical protein [Niveibacterium umoris]MBB4012784.1 hypothetical protein [Niveibacterium umoris]
MTQASLSNGLFRSPREDQLVTRDVVERRRGPLRLRRQLVIALCEAKAGRLPRGAPLHPDKRKEVFFGGLEALWRVLCWHAQNPSRPSLKAGHFRRAC